MITLSKLDRTPEGKAKRGDTFWKLWAVLTIVGMVVLSVEYAYSLYVAEQERCECDEQ